MKKQTNLSLHELIACLNGTFCVLDPVPPACLFANDIGVIAIANTDESSAAIDMLLLLLDNDNKSVRYAAYGYLSTLSNDYERVKNPLLLFSQHIENKELVETIEARASYH